MKILKHRLSGLLLMVVILTGFSPPAVPQTANALWMDVAKTRAALKAKADENLVRQFSYDDLKIIHKIGPAAVDTVLLIQDLLKDSQLSAEELVRAALRESKMKGEGRFRMKIILERAVSAVGERDQRSNDPNSPYQPRANDPNSPY